MPVPVAVTAEPTKFKVVAPVDREEPSSCTVIAPAVSAPASQRAVDEFHFNTLPLATPVSNTFEIFSNNEFSDNTSTQVPGVANLSISFVSSTAKEPE